MKDEKGSITEVLHLFRCQTRTHADTDTDTHTHTPGRRRFYPERQEEEKTGHKRRAEG